MAGADTGVRTTGRGGLAVLPGDPLRPGATAAEGGVTFTVSSAATDAMWLVLLDPADGWVIEELRFPDAYRCGDVFTMTVPGLDPDRTHYAFRAERGGRRGPLLLDPYARSLAGGEQWGSRPRYRCRVARRDFDWQGTVRPRHAAEDLVVYELHVRGFTRHASSGVRAPGSYAGVTEKLPYLRDLGVNCIELMPVFEFDDTDNPFTDPDTGRPLPNYWGYNPVALFAPKAAYAAHPYGDGPVRELKELVREAHRLGIEVLLDVVLNHTAEGNEHGPTLSLRGLDSAAYYQRTADGGYRNLTRTGNTVNANHPVTRTLLLDCLRHWAGEYRVDGFRFDMAPILARGTDGRLLDNPPLLEAISHDPALAGLRLIAEPFDADGLDLVGRFPGSFPGHGRWQEWNPRFMYTVRRFLTGAVGDPAELALRLTGSPDLYRGRSPAASVNYVASHDGFTLADWTAYEMRHNHANGEGGHDGPEDNASWNAGHEGPTDDPEVLRLRRRLVRGALLLLCTAHGTPQLTAGDEAGRTQGGNNNAYSQDNGISWINWAPEADGSALRGFLRACLEFRAAHPVLRRDRHLEDTALKDTAPDGLLVLRLHDRAALGGRGDTVLVLANSRSDERKVELPRPPSGTRWLLFADTSAEPGQDLYRPWSGSALALAGHGVAVFTAVNNSCPGAAP